ncbi:MAG: hypothetical protein ACI9YT_001561 [Halobacteriales archaeon]
MRETAEGWDVSRYCPTVRDQKRPDERTGSGRVIPIDGLTAHRPYIKQRKGVVTCREPATMCGSARSGRRMVRSGRRQYESGAARRPGWPNAGPESELPPIPPVAIAGRMAEWAIGDRCLLMSSSRRPYLKPPSRCFKRGRRPRQCLRINPPERAKAPLVHPLLSPGSVETERGRGVDRPGVEGGMGADGGRTSARGIPVCSRTYCRKQFKPSRVRPGNAAQGTVDPDVRRRSTFPLRRRGRTGRKHPSSRVGEAQERSREAGNR